MSEAVNTTNQAAPMVIHEVLPREVITQIFARLVLATKFQVRLVCHQWSHIVTEMMQAEITVIQATHTFASSIFNQNNHSVSFQIKLYKEIVSENDRWKYIFSSPFIRPDLIKIITYLIRQHHMQDALNAVSHINQTDSRYVILSEVIVSLASDSQFELIKELKTALEAKEQSHPLFNLAGISINLALNTLLANNRLDLAKKLFNCCFIPADCTPEERDALLAAEAQNPRFDRHVQSLAGIMRQEEAQLRAQGPGGP